MQKNSDHLEYLYKLENTLYRPSNNYTNDSSRKNHMSSRIRHIIIDWLYEVNEMFKGELCFFGLTVTLMDIYYSLNFSKESLNDDILQKDRQGVVCMCLNIVESIIAAYPSPITDFVFITDGAYTKKEFVRMRAKIITVLEGILIRPSQVFFVENSFINAGELSKVKSLIAFTYYIGDLMIYKPSLIAETVYFILSGKHDKYTLSEISQPCKILSKAINKVNISFKMTQKLKDEILDIKNHLKANCGDHLSKIEHIKREREDVDTRKYRFENYEQLNMMGEGTFSKVFKIKHNDNFYAVKYYKRPEVINEIACLKLLSSKKHNIITLEDFKMHKKGAFLFFEFGEFNLDEIIKKNLLNFQKLDIVTLFQDILKAVSYCHYNDIIHGDIKPENIVWVKDHTNLKGHLKLIDLGSSLPYGSYRQNYPKMLPNLITTATYRAPEVFLGDRHYTEKIDIWAIGLVFYFMITRDVLFERAAHSNDMIMGIFKLFGAPDEKTWPGVTDLSDWKGRYGVINFKFDKKNFEAKLGIYYSIVMECLHLNPKDRPDVKNMLRCSEIID